LLLVGDRDAVAKQYVELKNPRQRKAAKGKGKAVTFDVPDLDGGAGSSDGAAGPRDGDMFQLEQAWLEEYLGELYGVLAIRVPADTIQNSNREKRTRPRPKQPRMRRRWPREKGSCAVAVSPRKFG
jgi:hypothetical protein